jgi:hypothetical protein
MLLSARRVDTTSLLPHEALALDSVELSPKYVLAVFGEGRLAGEAATACGANSDVVRPIYSAKEIAPRVDRVRLPAPLRVPSSTLIVSSTVPRLHIFDR